MLAKSFGTLMWVCTPRYYGNTDSWNCFDENEDNPLFPQITDNRLCRHTMMSRLLFMIPCSIGFLKTRNTQCMLLSSLSLFLWAYRSFLFDINRSHFQSSIRIFLLPRKFVFNYLFFIFLVRKISYSRFQSLLFSKIRFIGGYSFVKILPSIQVFI